MNNENINLFIATPMYGGMCHGDYSLSLIHLLDELKQNNIKHHFNFLYNESLITRARNVLAHEFLLKDYTHLLFLDADVVVNPKDVLSLFEQDKDLIGGIYPKKHIDWRRIHSAVNLGCPVDCLSMEASEYAFNVFDGEDPRIHDPKQLMKVKNVATGYMLIKRTVFEQMKTDTETYIDNNVFAGQRVHNFFDTCIDNDNLLSEDYYFCKKWTDLGGEIYIAPWARANHIGMHKFG